MKKTALLLMTLTSMAALGGTASGLPGLPGRAGGSTVDTSGFVTKTTDAGVFYVNVDGGSNSNACITAGAACATLSGVIAKFPEVIKNDILINVASGTYEDEPIINQTFAANLTITGAALMNVTPSTGTATGTFTAINNTDGIYTDSAQTWTVNDLRGKFLVATSGPATGVVRAIAANTATTVTVAWPFTSSPPVVTNTFSIQTPSTIIRDTLDPLFFSSPGLIINAVTTGRSATIKMTNIHFQSQVDYASACLIGSGGLIQTVFYNSMCDGAGVDGTGVYFSGGVLELGNTATSASVSVVSGAYGLRVFQIGDVFASTGPNLTLSGAGALLYGSTYSALSVESTSSAFRFYPYLSGTRLGMVTGGTYGIDAINQLSVVQARIWCTGATGTAISSRAGTSTNAFKLGFSSIYITGCTQGISLTDPSTTLYISTRLDCGGVAGTCVSVSNGARARLPTTFNTDAGIDISIDGNSYTKADLTSASPTRLPTAATVLVTPNLTGSTVWQ